MSKRILVIQGHPDNSAPHLNYALADAYTEGARATGHEVRVVTVSALDFPLLRSQHDWEHGKVPASLKSAQDSILWAQHLVVFFPLWLGGMPAVLKAFIQKQPDGRQGLTRPKCPSGCHNGDAVSDL